MPESKVTREDVISAAHRFVQDGIKSPDELLDGDSEDGKKLWLLHDNWVEQESQRIKTLPFSEAIRARVVMDTIWYDAGFTGIDILDKIASDWLVNALGDADYAHRRDLASEIKAKIREIQEKIKEQDPAYEVWDPDSMTLFDWNPPRNAPPAEFYADYAYFAGPEKATVDKAASKYLQFHPDADSSIVKTEMEKAAEKYTEN